MITIPLAPREVLFSADWTPEDREIIFQRRGLHERLTMVAHDYTDSVAMFALTDAAGEPREKA